MSRFRHVIIHFCTRETENQELKQCCSIITGVAQREFFYLTQLTIELWVLTISKFIYLFLKALFYHVNKLVS